MMTTDSNAATSKQHIGTFSVIPNGGGTIQASVDLIDFGDGFGGVQTEANIAVTVNGRTFEATVWLEIYAINGEVMLTEDADSNSDFLDLLNDAVPGGVYAHFFAREVGRKLISADECFGCFTLKLDAFQGVDREGNPFGYIEVIDGLGDESGGWFFTWLPTDEQTIASIEPAAEHLPKLSEKDDAEKFLTEKLAAGLRGRTHARHEEVPVQIQRVADELKVSEEDAVELVGSLPTLRGIYNLGDLVVGIASDMEDAEKLFAADYAEADGLNMENASKIELPSGKVAVAFVRGPEGE